MKVMEWSSDGGYARDKSVKANKNMEKDNEGEKFVDVYDVKIETNMIRWQNGPAHGVSLFCPYFYVGRDKVLDPFF